MSKEEIINWAEKQLALSTGKEAEYFQSVIVNIKTLKAVEDLMSIGIANHIAVKNTISQEEYDEAYRDFCFTVQEA